jgi:uncharacterized membrane protein YidH (DUF202 family)
VTGHEPSDQFEDGLQRERTALAWTRTALTLIVASSVLIRYLGTPYYGLVYVPAYVTLVAGIVVLWLAARDDRWQTKNGVLTAQLRPSRAWIVGVTSLVVNVASLLIVIARH